MALTINTNLFALNTQRNLRKSEMPLATAMQRLSSGLRINSSKDDAAGLAIATRMTRQINGLTVAMRNANDGVSFSQTAEGALDEMVSALQRIYELAEQSASYNTSTDRDSMNQEVTELVAELNRVVTQTRYNGEQFLNQAKSIDVQVGVEVKETINISTSNVSPNTMGVSSNYNDTMGGTDIAKAASLTYISAGLGVNATLNGKELGDAIVATSVKNNSITLVNRINEYTGTHGVTAFSYGNSMVGGSSIITAGLASAAGSQYVDSGFLTINGTQIGSFMVASAGVSGTTGTEAVSQLVQAINSKSSTTGVVAYTVDKNQYDLSTTGTASAIIVLANTTGAAISVSLNSTVTLGTVLSNILMTDATAATTKSVSAGANGKIIFNGGYTDSSASFDGSATGVAFGVGSNSTSASLTQRSVNDVSVNSSANANIAILIAKQGLETFNTEKAKLGAKLNRLESTIRNLDNVRENISAARSRIMDADFAIEVTNLTKMQIVQQAGISMLSQANTLPQQVLALLGGR